MSASRPGASRLGRCSLAGAAGLVLLAGPALAQIDLTPNLALSGYVTGSAWYEKGKVDGGPSASDSHLEVDSIKLQFDATFDQVSGTVSLHSFGDSDPVFLDAYVSYDFENGAVITLGKFLSYLGYEAFDFPNMLQISYANEISGFIPAYHSGVKVDYTTDTFTTGVAVLDSVYGSDYYRGDQSLDNGIGVEAYFKYTAIEDTTLFFGLAYERDSYWDTKTFVADFWAETLVGETTLAVELCYSETDYNWVKSDGYFWLLLANQPLGDRWAVTGRISGGKNEDVGPDAKFTKFTVSPSVTLTENLGILFEYSYTRYKGVFDGSDGFGNAKAHFLAAQFVFSF